MIYLDRIIRYITKDIYLPKRCYVTHKDGLNMKNRCKCNSFCRKLSGKGNAVCIKLPIK